MTFYNIGSFSQNNYYKNSKDLELEKKEESTNLVDNNQDELMQANSIAQDLEKELTVLTPEEIEEKLREQKAIYLNSLNNYFVVLSDKSKIKVQQTMLNIIEKALEEEEEESEENQDNQEVIKLTTSADITDYLNNANVDLLNTIEKEIGDISAIGSIEISPTGQITILTDGIEIIADSSGNCVVNHFAPSLEIPNVDIPTQEKQPDLNFSDEEIETNTTEETTTETTETSNETVVETTEETITETTTETITEETQSDSVETPVESNESSSNDNVNIDSSASITSAPAGTEDLQGKLDSLVQEKQETQNDLTQQQDNLDTTEAEKDSTLGEIDSNIETEEANLDEANTEVDNSQVEVDNATQDVQSAQTQVESTADTKDNAKTELDTAVENVDSATDTKDTKETTKEEKVAEEATAKDESTTANNDLTTATKNTDKAQEKSNEKNQELSVVTTQSVQAFSVLNQANSEVASAQNEYNNAQAQATSFIENAWNKFKNWISSALSKLQAAITRRDSAEVEAERKQQEQEKAQVASEEAIEELNNRKQEQVQAQDVADAAQVVLDKATGAREVSEQEYADALLVLVDAMDEKESANGEYNSALESYLEAKDYKVNADGILVNAQGELVDAQDVVKDLETIVVDLSQTRKQEETSYNNILNNIEGVIKNDKTKIKQLNVEIKNVKKEIQEEAERIALQEQMLAQMQQEKSEFNAQEETDGIGDDILELFGAGSEKDRKEIERKQALLEKALLSGNQEEIMAAYVAIYGSSELFVDASGNIVDTSTMTEEELAKCSVTTISALDSKNLNAYAKKEAQASIEAQNIIKYMNAGIFTFNGEEISTKDLTEALLLQCQNLNTDVTNAREQQGWLSGACSGLNAQLGFGTTSMNAQAQVAMTEIMIKELNNCTTPSEYAAKFKAITGQNLDSSSVVMLLSSNQLNQPKDKQIVKEPNTKVEGKIDLSSSVNMLTKEMNSNENYSPRAISLLNNSTAVETIEEYKEAQHTLRETTVGVVTGIVSAVVASVAVAAAPFTGGSSLLLGAGVGALVGTGTSLLLGVSDSVYDSDGDASFDFNYDWEGALKDAFTGALNGLIGAISNGIGTKVTTFLTNKFTSATVSTTLKESVKNVFGGLASKAVGNTIEGAIDGGFSSGMEYMYRAATDENIDFSFDEFLSVTTTGTLFGSLMNVTLGSATDLIGGGSAKIKNLNLEKQINDVLLDGVSDNKLALLLANKIDDSLLTPDGLINHYAVNQLRKNTSDALSSVQNVMKKANLDPQKAYDVLESIPLKDMPNVSKVLDVISKPEFANVQEMFQSEDGINTFFKNLDGVEIDPKTGKLTEFSIKNGDDTFTFNFDKNGNLIGGLATKADGSQVKMEIANNGEIVLTDIIPDEKGLVVRQNSGVDAEVKADVEINDDVKPQAEVNAEVKADVEINADVKPQAEVNDVISIANELKGVTEDSTVLKYISENFDEAQINSFKELKANGWTDAAALNNIQIKRDMVDIPELNKYVTTSTPVKTHTDFYSQNQEFFANNLEQGCWSGHKSSNQEHGAWKMHLYSVEEADWQKMSEAIIPYLRDNDIEWKTFNGNFPATCLNGSVQQGKAFTIYPHNNLDFEKIASDLDYIIRKNDLEIPTSNIIGDNNLGTTGRIFYRYEFNSKEYKDLVLDFSTRDDYGKYEMIYDSNSVRVRATNGKGSYLAADMSVADDPFYNFDPSIRRTKISQ